MKLIIKKNLINQHLHLHANTKYYKIQNLKYHLDKLNEFKVSKFSSKLGKHLPFTIYIFFLKKYDKSKNKVTMNINTYK